MTAIIGALLRVLRIVEDTAGRHRLDRAPHLGYADRPALLAELLETRGRHAA
jgi:hypothetical protein